LEDNWYLSYICTRKRITEGNEKRSLLLFSKFWDRVMNDGTTLKKIENFVAGITSTTGTVFPVEIKISPANDIKVFLDADDGITIEKCTSVNKALYKYIEESGLFPDGNFSLEVSSPGVDEPLKLHRQYVKNTGRKVEVLLNDGNRLEGTLTGVDEDAITIEERTGKANKAIIKSTTISFNQIKHTTVLITF
jgi:ribosome maturation factor RimP